MKSSAYYFHMKTQISGDFQDCTIVPLSDFKQINYLVFP